MVTIQELLTEGFSFIDGIPEALIYNITPTICITYLNGVFELCLNSCCWSKLNIDNINDLILTIELFKNGEPVC